MYTYINIFQISETLFSVCLVTVESDEKVTFEPLSEKEAGSLNFLYHRTEIDQFQDFTYCDNSGKVSVQGKIYTLIQCSKV